MRLKKIRNDWYIKEANSIIRFTIYTKETYNHRPTKQQAWAEYAGSIEHKTGAVGNNCDLTPSPALLKNILASVLYYSCQ